MNKRQAGERLTTVPFLVNVSKQKNNMAKYSVWLVVPGTSVSPVYIEAAKVEVQGESIVLLSGPSHTIVEAIYPAKYTVVRKVS